MHRGYIKCWRRLRDSEFWLSEKFTRAQAWVDLLMLANHKDGHFRVRGQRVDVKRGQLAYSELSLAERWKWSRGRVRRYLAELSSKTVQQIVQQKNNVTTLITIINYELYQGDGTTDETTDGTPDGTRSKKLKTSLSDFSIQTATRLRDLITSRNPKFKQPNLTAWAKHIDLMQRLDGREEADILSVIEWCQADSFWCSNILSTAKLREKFDQLYTKMRNGNRPGQPAAASCPPPEVFNFSELDRDER